MAGRPPKALQLKLIEGEKDRKRLNFDQPFPEPLVPEAPPEFCRVAQEEWDRLIPELDSCGLLTRCDRTVLALHCQTYAKWIKLVSEINTLQAQGWAIGDLSKQISLEMKLVEKLIRSGNELGLSPASRSKISVTKNKDANSKLESLLD